MKLQGMIRNEGVMNSGQYIFLNDIILLQPKYSLRTNTVVRWFNKHSATLVLVSVLALLLKICAESLAEYLIKIYH